MRLAGRLRSIQSSFSGSGQRRRYGAVLKRFAGGANVGRA
jgi:hypothetical protein